MSEKNIRSEFIAYLRLLKRFDDVNPDNTIIRLTTFKEQLVEIQDFENASLALSLSNIFRISPVDNKNIDSLLVHIED